MKKQIILALCIATMGTALLSSCQKESDTLSFRATISTYQSTSKEGKTYVDANRWVNWIDGDTVKINGNDYRVGITGTGSNRIATIDGVTVSENGYYAVYPYNRATATAGTAGWPTQILLPQVQNYKTDANGNQIVKAPMAAYCPAGRATASLDFKNLCALLKIELPASFDITQNEVAYIKVTSSNQPLWGVATISGTDNPTLSSPSISSLYATDNTVTLDCTNNGLHGSDGNPTSSGAAQGVASRGPFYIVLPPATNVSGLTIDIYVFNGTASSNSRRTVHLYSKSGSNAISIAANNIYTTGNLPTTYTEVPDVPYPNLGTGEFSVSRTKKVRFALGNLQWQGSTNTWRFAQNQWTAIGNATGNNTSSNRSTQANWIDLFGYGTSGVNYQPYQTSNSSSDYASSAIQNTSNDWGVNEISNGGNQPNKWRTLTKDEWQYLFRLNSTTGTHPRDGRQGLATLTLQDGSTQIMGCILAPDDYNGISWTLPGQHHSVSWNDWLTHRSHGCIFLPCCGQRNVLNVTFGQSTNELDGYYWSSTSNGSNNAWRLRLRRTNNNSGIEVSCISETRYIGSGVRLVRDVD